MEKVLCLRIFYRWKIITSKNYDALVKVDTEGWKKIE